MRQTRSRTKALSLPDDVQELERDITTLSIEELRKLLNYRSTDKSSASSLRAKSYELLRSNYLQIKPKLKTILSHRSVHSESFSAEPRDYSSSGKSSSKDSSSSNTVTSTVNPEPVQRVGVGPASSFLQPSIGSYFYQYQQFAINNNTAALPQPQPQRNSANNSSLMYQSNLNMVSQTAATNNGVMSHTNGMVNSYVTPAVGVQQNYPVHPDVRLKKLAFFDVMATLLKPSTLLPTSNTQRMQECSFHFSLSPQQATDIAINRDIRNSSKIEHVVQVQLRFCVLETTSEQDDCFPPNVVVKVNNKLCQLPNPIPTNKPGVEPKRPPRPVNVTTNVRISPTVTNTIHVSWCTDYSRGFVLSAYLVKKLTSTQLLQRMKAKGIKAVEHTRTLIKEKLNEDADCEIATTMLKVSLVCPLGKMRMSTPCRASTCSHLQCFDASLYLQMNERKPTWNCPVCDKAAVYETLVIDGYFQDVLSSSNLPSDVNEIQLLKDGSWIVHDSHAEAQTVDTPRKSTHKVEVINDDIEVIITEDSPKASIKKHSENGENGQAKQTDKTNPLVTGDAVDLTLSDSDDEVVPVHRKGNNSASQGRGQSGTPVITNDPIVISLDSPSPPSSPSRPVTGNQSLSSHAAAIPHLSAVNPFSLPDATSITPTYSDDREDPLRAYKDWLNQYITPSSGWTSGSSYPYYDKN